MNYKYTTTIQYSLSSQVDRKDGGIIKVCVSKKTGEFNGQALYILLTACGLNLEEDGFFTRHERGNKSGDIQFRIYNSDLSKGLENINEVDFTTPMITLMVDLAEPIDANNAFECMLATGECISNNLDGVVLNEDLSRLHIPTIRKKYNL